MNPNIQKQFTGAAAIILLLYITTDLYILSIFGVGLFAFFGIKFFLELGQKIEIRDLMILIASLQWIIGPILTYKFNSEDIFYYMAVEEDVYMNFVFSATLLFSLGLYFPLWNKRTDENIHLEKIKLLLKKNKNLDIILIAIGLVSDILVDRVPLSLMFLFFLFSGARFIGLYFFLLNERKNKVALVSIIIFGLFVSALGDAMFHEFLLWMGFFFMIVTFIYKVGTRKKLVYLSGIIVLVVFIQTIKHEFRRLTSEDANKTALFATLVQKNFIETNQFQSNENLNAFITRINQGWIIARIMSWTPKYEPFCDGETIMEGVTATLLPRFLAPNKAFAGGKKNFARFTGKELRDGTSMNLSPLGEAYANFGVTGGAVFMLFLGALYNWVIFTIFKQANKRPTLIFFLPLLFLQVIKAETDLTIVVNHLFKASIAVVMLYFGLEKILNLKM